MRKGDLRKFVGKCVRVRWRDSISCPSWTDAPLEKESASVWTDGTIQGFNRRGELIIAGEGQIGDVDYAGNITVIPICLIKSVGILKESRK